MNAAKLEEALSKPDFDLVRALVREKAAIVLEDGKEYLVESRLTPLAAQEGFDSLHDLLAKIRLTPYGLLHEKVVEMMTTNETSFFRDLNPFEILRETVIPDLMQRRSQERGLHLWCAASSSGQEPYSLAMLLATHFPALKSWNFRFTASDLSTAMLEKARQAAYSQFEVNRGLPAAYLVRYFEKKENAYQLKDAIKQMVDFKIVNLIGSWPSFPPLDIVFIRNVLIYFDQSTKIAILKRIRSLLRPDGYLFLGGAEAASFTDIGFEWLPLRGSGCYRVR